MKYLSKKTGKWYIEFRLPKKFGGATIKRSLHTSDPKQAIYIRDMFILPIILNASIIEALEEIARKIEPLKTQSVDLIEQLKSGIIGTTGFSPLISDCLRLFLDYLEKSQKRVSTIQSYKAALNTSFCLLDDKEICNFNSKDALTLRDGMLNAKLSGSRIKNKFLVIKSFFTWCIENKYCRKEVLDLFKITLPKTKTTHTAYIPEAAANKAILLIKDWIVPRIARYTGMRLKEITRLTQKDIRLEGGIKCFYVDERTKTSKPRLVPIADKLLPYIKEPLNIGKLSHKDDEFNIKIKKIEGCEKCSFHSWRVYANSQMHKNGVDPYVCKKILGHSNSKDIHSGYTHIELEQMKKAVDMIY